MANKLEEPKELHPSTGVHSREDIPAKRPEEDLLAQARKLRRNHSTADIILDTRESTGLSNRVWIYLGLCVVLLATLFYLFNSPGSRQNMEERANLLSTVLAGDKTTSQTVSPENEHMEGRDSGAAVTRSDSPAGPFEISTKKTATLTPPPPPPAPAKAAPKTTAASSAPAAAPPVHRKPKPKPAAPLTPEKEAYHFLLESKPAFAGLVEGDTEEYRFKSYTTNTKDDGTFQFDFVFQKGNLGTDTHFIWEVKLADKSIRPIGLNSVRFDRMSLR